MADEPVPDQDEKLHDAIAGFVSDLSATEQLRGIRDTYARLAEASNSRIEQLASAQAQATIASAGVAKGTGAALEGYSPARAP